MGGKKGGKSVTKVNSAVIVSGYGQAEYVEVAYSGGAVSDEITGEAVVSLISPGTELAACFFGDVPFPKYPGYATVMRVNEVGEGVQDVRPGDYVFLMGNHQRFHKTSRSGVVPLPLGLDPKAAVIARLMGVSMTTLMTTAARPGDRVLVMGAGPVGYLAAHLFQLSGYRVTVCDPVPDRRELLLQSGIASVCESAHAVPSEYRGSFALAMDCSGHEAAVLEACRIVRKGGEVVLIGAPWRQYTELSAHELVHVIFHGYVHLRSGWEWELPVHATDFRPHSIMGNLSIALEWLNAGKIPLSGLIRSFAPQEAQLAYRSLADKAIKELFVQFDWEASRTSVGSTIQF